MKKIIIDAYPFIKDFNSEHKKDYTLDDFKERLSIRFAFGNENILSNGIYKEMGFMYDLRPFLKRYLVNTYDNTYQTYFAFNKKQIRDNLCLPYKTRIIEDDKI